MAAHAETKATGRQNATNISAITVMKSTEMNGNINGSTEDSSPDEDALTRPTSNKSGTAFSSLSETEGRIALSNQTSRSKSSPDFKCKFCDKEHEGKHYLTQHMIKEHKASLFTCQDCDFTSARNLKRLRVLTQTKLLLVLCVKMFLNGT